MAYSKLVDTLADLIRINSVNPVYPDGRSEAAIQKYVLEFFRNHGIPAYEQGVLPDRSNVIAVLPGCQPSRRVIFEAHSDTAGVEGMRDPFEPVIRDGRVYGRGACDVKAGLAAMMHALVDWKGSGVQPACEVWMVAAVDEEHLGRGASRLGENLQALGAIAAEPTGMRLVVASKGVLRWRFKVTGKPAHSSRPELGINAIDCMTQLLHAFSLDSSQLAFQPHPLVGRGTVNIGLIRGGTQVNIVPECCWAEVERRLIPGEDPLEVQAYYEEFLERLRASAAPAVLEMETICRSWSMETAPDSEVVLRAAAVLQQAGLPHLPTGVMFGGDASRLSRAGIPAIFLGPGNIDEAHTNGEYVELEQVEAAFCVYRRLMGAFE